MSNRRKTDHGDSRPLSLRQGVILMCIAITVSAVISISAALLQSSNSDSRQDDDFNTLCATVQRIAAVNAFRIEADAVAFRQAGQAIERGPNGPNNPISAALFRAAAAADVAAEAQDDFATSKCEDLPPRENHSIHQIRQALELDLRERLERFHNRRSTNQP